MEFTGLSIALLPSFSIGYDSVLLSILFDSDDEVKWCEVEKLRSATAWEVAWAGSGSISNS